MKKKRSNLKKLLVFILIIFLIGIICLFSIVLLTSAKDKPDIKLNGDDIVEIKLNQEYIEQGTSGSKEVTISGSVDNTKIGEYEIIYETPKTQLKRIVKVIDDIKPEITLRGSKDIYLYKGNEYVDIDKSSAKDNYDGELTDKINIRNEVNTNEVGDYKIIYEVSDSSGNKSSVERNIHVIDEKVSMNKIPILMYHFYYDSTKGETPLDNNWIDVSKFEEQIKYLSDNNYYYPTWNEIEMYLDKKIKLPEKSIVITVDDGDPSFFKYGTKILEKYNVLSTSFFVTSWYYRDQYEYNPELVSIQSHTNDMHVGGCSGKGKFLCIDRQKGIEDLKTSISRVDSAMVFCYPFGHHNDHTKSILKEVGFHMALTTVEGKIAPGMDKYTLPRVRVSGKESMNYFVKSIN